MTFDVDVAYRKTRSSDLGHNYLLSSSNNAWIKGER